VAAVAAHMGSLLEGFDARKSARLASEAELKALREKSDKVGDKAK
jgi:hypothetical protein